MALAGSGQIVVLKRDGNDGSIYPLHDGSIHIGNGKDCDIRIPVKGLAHKQCLITVTNTHATIKNLSNTSPTLVNTKAVDSKVLAHGDILSFNTGQFRWDYITQISSKRKSKGSTRPTFLVKRGRKSIGRRKSDTVPRKVDPQIKKLLYSRSSSDAVLSSATKTRQVAVVKPQRRVTEPPQAATPASVSGGKASATPSSARRQVKRTSSVASPDSDVLKVALTNKRRKINDVEKIDAPVMDKNKRAALMLLTGKSPLGRSNKNSPKGSPSRKSLSNVNQNSGDSDNIRSTPVKEIPIKSPRSVIKSTPDTSKSVEASRDTVSDTPRPKHVPSPKSSKTKATPFKSVSAISISKLPIKNTEITSKVPPLKSISLRALVGKASVEKVSTRRSIGRTPASKVTPVIKSALKKTPSTLYSFKSASIIKSTRQKTIVEDIMLVENQPVKKSFRRKLDVGVSPVKPIKEEATPARSKRISTAASSMKLPTPKDKTPSVRASTQKKIAPKTSSKKVLSRQLISPKKARIAKSVPKKIMAISAKSFYNRTSPIKSKPKILMTPKVSINSKSASKFSSKSASPALSAKSAKKATSKSNNSPRMAATPQMGTPKVSPKISPKKTTPKVSHKKVTLKVSSKKTTLMVLPVKLLSPKSVIPKKQFSPSKSPTNEASHTPRIVSPVNITPVVVLLRDTPIKGTPKKVSPVKKTPIKETPVKETPQKETSVKGRFVKGTQVKETPIKGTPIKGTTVKETPVKGTPIKGTPVKGPSVKGTSVKGTPLKGTPVKGTPVKGTPVKGTPVKETPVKGPHIKGTPVKETPVKGTPIKRTPVNERFTKGTPVKRTPVKATTVKEAPVKGTPQMETPIEGRFIKGTPVRATPQKGTPNKVSPLKDSNLSVIESPHSVRKSARNTPQVLYEDITPVVTPNDRTLPLKGRPTFTPRRPSPVSRRTPGFKSSLKRQSVRVSPGQAMSTPIRGTPVLGNPIKASRSVKSLRSSLIVPESFSPETSLLKSVSSKLSKSNDRTSSKSVTFFNSTLDTSDFEDISEINLNDSSLLRYSLASSLATPSSKSPKSKTPRKKASFVIRALKNITPSSTRKSAKKSLSKRKSSLKSAQKKNISIKGTPQILGNISPIVSPKPASPRTPVSMMITEDTDIVSTPNLSILFNMEASTPKPKETRKSLVRDAIKQFETQTAEPSSLKNSRMSKVTRQSLGSLGKQVQLRKSELEAFCKKSLTEPRKKLPGVQKAALRKTRSSPNNSQRSNKSFDQESNSSDMTDVNAPKPNNQIVITPKSTVKLQPEILKEKHSTAKKSVSRKAMIDHLTDSPDIVKELFKSPVKRKLSQSIQLYNSSIAFDDEQDTSIASAAKDASFDLLNSSRSPNRKSKGSPFKNTSLELLYSSRSPNRKSKGSPTKDKSFELLNTSRSSKRNSRGTPDVSFDFVSVNSHGISSVSLVSPLQDPLSAGNNLRQSMRNNFEGGLLNKSFRSPHNSGNHVAAIFKISPKSKVIRKHKSPKNDLTNVASIKRLLQTPKNVKSPKNDLTDVAGVKNLLKTPRVQKSPKNDLTNVAGVRALLKTPMVRKSPKNDLTNVEGIKRLLKTPVVPKSPKNDLRSVGGVKRLMKTPGKVNSVPKDDLTDVRGVKNLFNNGKSPKNDLRNVGGVKKLMKTPGKGNATPKNDLTNVRGVKNLFNSRVVKSPRNDLTNVAGVKKMFGSPRIHKSPNNSLNNISGVSSLFKSSSDKNKSVNNSISEKLFDSAFGKSPVKTYTKRSVTPVKTSPRGKIADSSAANDKSSTNLSKNQKFSEASTLIMKDESSLSTERSRRQGTIDRSSFSIEVSKLKVNTRQPRFNQLASNASILGQSTPAKLRKVMANVSEINIKQLSPIPLKVPKTESSVSKSPVSSTTTNLRGKKKTTVKKVATKKSPIAKKSKGKKVTPVKLPAVAKTIVKKTVKIVITKPSPVKKVKQTRATGVRSSSESSSGAEVSLPKGRGRNAKVALATPEQKPQPKITKAQRAKIEESMEMKKRVTFASDVMKGFDDKPVIKTRGTRSGKPTVEAEVASKPKGKGKAAPAAKSSKATKKPGKKTVVAAKKAVVEEVAKPDNTRGRKRSSLEVISPIAIKRTRRGAVAVSPKNTSVVASPKKALIVAAPKNVSVSPSPKKAVPKATKKGAKTLKAPVTSPNKAVTPIKKVASKAKVSPKLKASPKTKVAPKAKAAPKSKTLPKSKVAPKSKAAPKFKAATSTKASPAPKKAVKTMTEKKSPKVTRSTRQRK